MTYVSQLIPFKFQFYICQHLIPHLSTLGPHLPILGHHLSTLGHVSTLGPPSVNSWSLISQLLVRHLSTPGLEVIKLEYSLGLKIKRNDWLLAAMCPQAANHCALLAHLSRRLIGELIVYQWLRRPASVRSLSTFSNIFSSETTGPIELIFHMETP